MRTRVNGKKGTPMLLIVLVGALLCPGGSLSAAAEKDTLTIAITADPRNISPVSASTFHDWVVGYRAYSSLFQADPDFQPVPDLAESWDVSPDSLTYTFHLKRSATFHDGSPITSGDVKFSIE
jgi:peptide/nickel transport system substrate-binding protein